MVASAADDDGVAPEVAKAPKNLETPKNAIKLDIKPFGARWILDASGRRAAAPREGFSHATREVCFPSGLHPPYTYITAGTIRRSFTYGG